MKTLICDLCKQEGKITLTERYVSIRKTSARLDVCPAHALEIKKLSTVEFVKLSYKVVGVEVSDDEAKKLLVIR